MEGTIEIVDLSPIRPTEEQEQASKDAVGNLVHQITEQNLSKGSAIPKAISL
jgi:hypothetical protein